MTSRRNDASHIYIIQGGNGLLKIGMSRHPKKRLKELQASSAARLVLLDVTSVAEAVARQIGPCVWFVRCTDTRDRAELDTFARPILKNSV